MIKYEKFIEFINKRIKIENDMDELNNILKKISSNSNGFYWGSVIELLDDMIKELLNDKYDELSWFIYEKEWGKNQDVKMWDENNNLIPTDTLKDIYNIIVEDNKI